MLAGVPQGFVLGPLFFLILSSYTKLFADDTFIFSTVKNVDVSTDQLNSDSQKNLNWDFF